MDLIREKVELEVADGTRMGAYTARPESGQYPAIIVFQEAFGVNCHIRDVTDRLANQGYVAIAPELFHRTAPGFEGDYGNFPAVAPHVQAITLENAEHDVRAAYHWLRSCPYARPDDVSSVGFCMGGRMSFLANAALPLRAAASFYGAVPAELLSRAAELHGPMLLIWGLLDKRIGAEQRNAVKTALDQNQKVYASTEFSNADHGFFCNQRPVYQPEAARQAWALLLEFLRPQGS